MKLKVAILDAPGIVGGKGVLLCDDAGEPLPNQSEIQVTNAADGDMPTITVTFGIDGESVRFLSLAGDAE